MIIIDNIDQGSPEWLASRAGVPSSSCFDKIFTSKGLPSKQRKAYMYQLAGEAVLGEKQESYTNAAMERGIELEAEARALYEFNQGVEVKAVGLCKHDTIKCSCSPDGLIGEDGGLEIKCPSLHTHVEYLVGKKLPTKYVQQVQGSLFVTGRDWWDFVSYYPGMRMLTVRVYRDDDLMVKIAVEIEKFCSDLDYVVNHIKTL